MKKLFALVLALCLLCGCTALAETARNRLLLWSKPET